MFMFKKNRRLFHKIEDYLATAEETLRDFKNDLKYVFENGRDAHFEKMTNEIHVKESRADDIRQEIELDLYEKALLPESREDLFLMLERLDMLPNQAEDILRTIWIQQLDIPAFLHQHTLELAGVAVDCFHTVAEGVLDVLGKGTKTRDIVRKIDTAESVGDQLEQKLVAEVFRSDMPDGQKILLRDIIREIGSLCDLSDDVSLLLSIFNVKRRV